MVKSGPNLNPIGQKGVQLKSYWSEGGGNLNLIGQKVGNLNPIGQKGGGQLKPYWSKGWQLKQGSKPYWSGENNINPIGHKDTTKHSIGQGMDNITMFVKRGTS